MAIPRRTLRFLVPLVAVALTTGAAAFAAEPRENAWLGIFLGDALDGGVQVVAVVPDGPAARGGLKRGDVVLAVGGRETEDRVVLGEAVDRFRPGETVPIRVLREGRVTDLRVTADRSPISFSWRFETPPSDAEGTLPGGFAAVPDDPVLGVTFREIPPELRLHFGAPADAGILVAAVAPGSAGARAGLRVGDVVVRMAGKPVSRALDLALASVRDRSGKPLALDAVRAGRPLSLRLDLDPDLALDRETMRREVAEREAEIRRLRKEVEVLERALEEARREADRDAP